MGAEGDGPYLSFFRNWRCLLGLALVFSLNLIWEVLNQAPAVWDMAYHQLMGWNYAEAIRSGRIWWEWASLSPAYPPLYYLHEGLVFLCFPGSEFRTFIVNLPYILLTSYATYRIASMGMPPAPAAWASVLVLLFPAAALVQREALLDGALAAWVVLGAWLILQSRFFSKRGWTLLFGVICALGSLTKWTFPLYLVVPVLWSLLAAENPLRSLLNLAGAGGIAVAVALPYYGSHLLDLVARYPTTEQSGLIPWRPYPRHGEPGLNNIWGWIYYPRVLASYFLYLPLTVFCLVGVARRFSRGAKSSRLVSFLWVWLAGCLVLLTFLTPKDPRFALPMAAPLSILIVTFWQRRRGVLRLIVAIAFFQFVAFSLPLFPSFKIAFFGVPGDRNFLSLQREWVLFADNYFGFGPPVQEDWKLSEVVARVGEGKSIAVLPALPRFQFGALQLEAVEEGRSVHFFDANEGPYRDDPLAAADFVVAKTGDQGLPLITGRNQEWMRRLREEGWRQIGEWPLPDGGRSELWQAPGTSRR